MVQVSLFDYLHPLGALKPAPSATGIFIKWLSASRAGRIERNRKILGFRRKKLALKSLKGWRNFTVLSRLHSKTMRSVVMFRQASLKVRVFSLWAKMRKPVKKRKTVRWDLSHK